MENKEKAENEIVERCADRILKYLKNAKIKNEYLDKVCKTLDSFDGITVEKHGCNKAFDSNGIKDEILAFGIIFSFENVESLKKILNAIKIFNETVSENYKLFLTDFYTESNKVYCRIHQYVMWNYESPYSLAKSNSLDLFNNHFQFFDKILINEDYSNFEVMKVE